MSESISPGVIPHLSPRASPEAGEGVSLVPRTISPYHNHPLPLTPVICDTRAIAGLLERLLSQADLSKTEAARQLGINVESVRQYLNGRRVKPSLMWFIRFVELCGGRVIIEWPSKVR